MPELTFQYRTLVDGNWERQLRYPNSVHRFVILPSRDDLFDILQMHAWRYAKETGEAIRITCPEQGMSVDMYPTSPKPRSFPIRQTIFRIDRRL